MSWSPRRADLALALSALLCGGVACDTIKARREASAAAALYKEGELTAAADKYAAAEALDPSIATIHLNLGFASLSLFQAAPKGPEAGTHGARAVEEFRKYIAMKPEDPRGRSFLIQTFVDTRRYDDAVAFFQPEVEGASPSVEAIGVLGQIAAKVGRFDEALTWYGKRQEVAPRDAEGFVGMGVLVWQHLHEHLEVSGPARLALADRGITALKKSIELQPAPPEPYTYVNLLYRERAAGYLCAVLDGGVPAVASPAPPPSAAPAPVPAWIVEAEQCWKSKAADIAEADKYLRIALDKLRVKSGAPTPASAAASSAAPSVSPSAAPAGPSSKDGGAR